MYTKEKILTLALDWMVVFVSHDETMNLNEVTFFTVTTWEEVVSELCVDIENINRWEDINFFVRNDDTNLYQHIPTKLTFEIGDI